jgi:hypothetical protein
VQVIRRTVAKRVPLSELQAANGAGNTKTPNNAFSEFAQHLARLLPTNQDACRFADYLVEFSDGDEEEFSDQQQALVQNLLTQAADLYSLAGMVDRAGAVRERSAALKIGALHAI